MSGSGAGPAARAGWAIAATGWIDDAVTSTAVAATGAAGHATEAAMAEEAGAAVGAVDAVSFAAASESA